MDKTKKLKLWIYLLLAVVAALIIALVVMLNNKAKTVTSISFKDAYVEMFVDEKKELESVVLPETASDVTVTYVSENPNIVEVSDNTIISVNPGTTIVKVCLNDNPYDELVIKVNDVIPTDISVNESEELIGEIGRSFKVPFIFTPANSSDLDMDYSFSKPDMATSQFNEIVGLQEGTVTVTAKHKTTGIETAFDLKFVPVGLEDIKLSLPKEIKIGDEVELQAQLVPEDATDKTVKWSSDSSCLTVSEGKLIAQKEGKANITAKGSNGVSKSMEITVSPVEAESIQITGMAAKNTMNVGDSLSLTATINPANTTDKKVIWESSNTNVATVSNGTVYAKSAGSARITASTSNGKKVSVDLTIKPKPVNQSNGFIKRPSSYGQCPVKVNAPKDESVYVYFTCSDNSSNDFSMFVKAGTSCEVDVPSGTYVMFYASGDTWYGKDYKFGDDTEYFTSSDKIKCYISGNYANGCELTLYKVVNGNMETSEIPEVLFPG